MKFSKRLTAIAVIVCIVKMHILSFNFLLEIHFSNDAIIYYTTEDSLRIPAGVLFSGMLSTCLILYHALWAIISDHEKLIGVFNEMLSLIHLSLLGVLLASAIPLSPPDYTMKYLVMNYNKDIRAQEKTDVIQKIMQCCGHTSYLDWKTSAFNSSVDDNSCLFKIPASCMKHEAAANSDSYTVVQEVDDWGFTTDDQESAYYPEGCHKKLKEFRDKGFIHLMIVGVLLCTNQIAYARIILEIFDRLEAYKDDSTDEVTRKSWDKETVQIL